MYTDGVTEARRNGELYGEQRLFGLLSRLDQHAPDAVVRDVIAAVTEYAGDDLRDDVALLAVQWVACRRAGARRQSPERSS